MAEKTQAMDIKSKAAQTVDPDIAVEPGDMELLGVWHGVSSTMRIC